MRSGRFLDTNILLYSISTVPDEAGKRDRAAGLLDREDNALSVQVLTEFYVQATRPSRANAISHGEATTLIRAWTRFPVQDITLGVMEDALEIRATYGFSYWDSAIISAAKSLGCPELCTEDMSHGREVAGVRIVNPFR
jgi:predicted nucleic acid-binding protein